MNRTKLEPGLLTSRQETARPSLVHLLHKKMNAHQVPFPSYVLVSLYRAYTPIISFKLKLKQAGSDNSLHFVQGRSPWDDIVSCGDVHD